MPMDTLATVAKMKKEDSKSDVVDVMVSAFLDDPVTRELYQHSSNYEGSLRALFEATIDYRMVDTYIVRTGEGAVAGFVVYENETPPFLREELAIGFYEFKYSGWYSSCLTGWRMVTGLGPILTECHKKYQPEGGAYVKFFGVSSKYQGKGYGTLLLSKTLELEADRHGRAAYLESSNERNLTIYKRHGFVVQEETPYGKAKLFPMVREAKASDSAESGEPVKQVESDAQTVHRRK